MIGIHISTMGNNPEKLFSVMDSIFNDMTEKAARGECAWICSDCCCSFDDGMPDVCVHGDARCTEIIQRDKAAAQSAVDNCGRDLS